MTAVFNERLRRPVFRYAALASVSAVLAIVLAGCGGSASADGSTHVLTTAQAKRLLLQLPYAYRFRPVPLPEGASGVLAGRVVNKHHTFVNFGIALGKESKAVSVPRSGTGESYGYPYGGFLYTDDLQVPDSHGNWILNPRFHTTREFHMAADMNIAITEKLCKAATGEPCHEG